MNRRQRFSLRKYKFGLASVLLGTALVFGASQVSANEQSTGENQAQTQEIKTELKDDKHSNSATDLTTANGIAPVSEGKQEVEASKIDTSNQFAKKKFLLIKLLKPRNQEKIAQLQMKKIKVSFKKKQQSIPVQRLLLRRLLT